MAKKTGMTENSKKVFNFLKGNGAGVRFTAKQIQEALGLETIGAVTGSVTGLTKKGYAVWEKVEEEVDGKKVKKSYCYLTPEGASFDPDAVTEG